MIDIKIIISNSSSTPIYEQIKNAIISQIMNGELKEDENIPSIRSFEQEGYIITRQGKGSFVAPKNTELAKEQAKKDIEKHISQIIMIANKFDISNKDILDLFKFLMEDTTT